MVSLEEGSQQLQATIPVRLTATSNRYVNMLAQGRCEIVDEQLDLSLKSLQLGSIAIPQAIAEWLGRMATRWISSDSANRELLLGVVSATADNGSVELIVSNDGITRRRLAQTLRQIGDQPDVSKAVGEHLILFAETAKKADRNQMLFDQITRISFRRRGGSIPGR